MFEPHQDVNINDPMLFLHYAENYLEDFHPAWAGRASMSHSEKVEGKLEPVWQFMIRDSDNSCRQELLNYLDRNPMEGYWVHVYEEELGEPAKKVH